MNKLATLCFSITVLLAACTKREPAPPTGISEEGVNDIIESLTPKPFDYEARQVRFIISPDQRHLYVLESQKEWTATALKAKPLDNFRWQIQLDDREPTVAFVTLVKSTQEFRLAFPTLLANISLGIKGICKSGADCTQPNTLETAGCNKLKGTYYKDVFYNHFCECNTEAEGTCIQIYARVGTRYFYNDQINCSGEPSKIRGEVWKETCLYDKNSTL
mgnify:CR=1 FL=1